MNALFRLGFVEPGALHNLSISLVKRDECVVYTALDPICTKYPTTSFVNLSPLKEYLDLILFT